MRRSLPRISVQFSKGRLVVRIKTRTLVGTADDVEEELQRCWGQVTIRSAYAPKSLRINTYIFYGEMVGHLELGDYGYKRNHLIRKREWCHYRGSIV